jgi:hypothetical protein
MKVDQSFDVLSCEQAMMNLIKMFAFLGDSLHDCIINSVDISALAEVGGMIEHKAMIADLQQQVMWLIADNKILKDEVERLTLMRAELENIVKMTIK